LLLGIKNGLDYLGYTLQTHFLLGLGLNEHIRKMEEDLQGNYFSARQKEFFVNTFLGDMGIKLKVQIQQKGVVAQSLSGLKFPVKNLL
jgi:hypothetical protein